MPATFGRSSVVLVAALVLGRPAGAQTSSKVDPLLQTRLSNPVSMSRVIVRAADAPSLDAVELLIEQAGGTRGRRLPILDATVAEIPDAALTALASSPLVRRISLDRAIYSTLHRTSHTVGAAAIREQLGYDGSGVGVAVIDSGVTAWHDDLAIPGTGTQRVTGFIDFVDGATSPHDDYGHGTHVAGIIGGNGFDSGGARAGIAPGSDLFVLKVLDRAGRGRISDVIAAIGYVVENRVALRTRIINLSIGAGVFESYATDLLTLAARKAVDAGIVVVASAGNAGRDPNGRTRYGGITAPGNAPWVLTVGASSHMGTLDRADDTIAGFSSRGPTAIDRAAKPDLVAPGVGIESLSDPHSQLFTAKPQMLLNGTVATPYAPYLSLSGTSQASPVVAGVVALMLQANPSLNPNAVKAILQYTAQMHPGYDALTQGAGFLNARGAVELARFLAAPDVVPYPAVAGWSRHLLWGNHRVRPKSLTGKTNVWKSGVAWGAARSQNGSALLWTSACADVGCLVEAPSTVTTTTTATVTTTTTTTTTLVSSLSSVSTSGNLSIQTLETENVVWGSLCGGANCAGSTWTPSPGVVQGTADGGETVVWGSTDSGDTVVWGSTDSGDTVVWGSTDSGDTVVWGSSDGGETVVWGSSDSGETVVWGSSGDEDVVWGRSADEPDTSSEETAPAPQS